MTRKLNKPIAGYHLLLLLTVADKKFAKEEGDIIIDYLSQNFPFRVNLDEEIEFLSTLPRGLPCSTPFPEGMSRTAPKDKNH